ncbi:hypothetical protein [Actinokineospora inagensis]|uniref:hypothetical protein n=1 Tax=Actinokineospora inagensis TaxID=103730 RepID=UPI0012F72054|nr:hypothetical protein [Actinokineospora inagensis]
MRTSEVVVVDLRHGGSPPSSPAGGVVVVDSADQLAVHAEVYLSLVGADMVTDVICVAVGESGTGDPLDGVVLTMPPALRHATVLWVGDPVGVEWAPEHTVPRPAARPGEDLDALVAALRDPTLFDRVVAAAEELPAAAASPGIRLVSHAVDRTELAEARAAAVRSLCAADQPATDDISVTIRQSFLLGGHEGAVLTGPVRDARVEALRRLADVAALAKQVGTPQALLGTARPTGSIATQTAWAGQAAENYRLGVGELLNRMDGQLQVGHPSVDAVRELGAPAPRDVDGHEIAGALRQAVDARLAAGAALPTVSRELRQLAASAKPQGCVSALDQVAAIGPLSLSLPEFRRWPIPILALPLIFLTCAAVAFLLGPGWTGWLAGALLASGWTCAGWLFLARRPGPEGEPGFGTVVPAALSVYGLSSLVGAVAGALPRGLVTELARPLMPELVADLLAVAVVLVSAVVVAFSWRGAVRQWRAAFAIDGVRTAIGELTTVADDTTAREWLPLLRRRATAAAAAEVAAGLDEVAGTLVDTGDQLFPPPALSVPGGQQMARPVPRELYTVVRGDLVDLARTALQPAWPAAESALRANPGVYAARLERLVDEYSTEVRRRGLLSSTTHSSDNSTRDDMLNRTWQESPDALAALRTHAGADMTQLCAGGQLRYLSTAVEPVLVRFAPAQLRRALSRDSVHTGLAGDPSVVWSEGGEFVGALRLLPLRAESVLHVYSSGGVNG